MDAILEHVLLSVDTAETETANLRSDLRREQQAHIQTMAVAYRWHVSINPLFHRMLKFSQIKRSELDFYTDALKSDHATMTAMVAHFKQRWGAAPVDERGREIRFPEYPKGRELAR